MLQHQSSDWGIANKQIHITLHNITISDMQVVAISVNGKIISDSKKKCCLIMSFLIFPFTDIATTCIHSDIM